MHILIAPDHFRPSVQASSAAEAIARGLRTTVAGAVIRLCPQTAGGRGTMDMVVRAQHGRIRHEIVKSREGRTVASRWAMLPDQTIVLDAAEILLHSHNPHMADSFCLGAMVHQMFRYRPKAIVVALGDMAGTDGGLGMLEALGVRYLDENGTELPFNPRTLGRVAGAACDGLDIPVPIVGLYDQPLSRAGPHGSQKPSRNELERVVAMVEQCVATELSRLPGTAAGGGLGWGLAVLGAQLTSGALFVAHNTGLAAGLAWADWVVTGSDRLSHLSADEVVGQVGRMGRDADKPVIALAATLAEGHARLYQEGVAGFYPILDRPRSAKDTFRATASLLEQTGERLGRWMTIFQQTRT
ncbi:MAG: glycerate kinase [Thermaerobacter sp.]|nr:glycerate kinase [Thermaerobacter sp.]